MLSKKKLLESFAELIRVTRNNPSPGPFLDGMARLRRRPQKRSGAYVICKHRVATAGWPERVRLAWSHTWEVSCPHCGTRYIHAKKSPAAAAGVVRINRRTAEDAEIFRTHLPGEVLNEFLPRKPAKKRRQRTARGPAK